MTRLKLPLADKLDWLRVFEPQGSGLFVPMPMPPPLGSEVRVDVLLGRPGPRVVLHGSVVWRRSEGKPPTGCGVAVSTYEREKINFVNGYVRGGLLDRRERRRLPVRLPVTYGGVEGLVDTHSRDINEEGIFILTEDPLPERSAVHFAVRLPWGDGVSLNLRGIVSHTVIVEDEDLPGMGVQYAITDEELLYVAREVDRLEVAFLSGKLPDEVLG